MLACNRAAKGQHGLMLRDLSGLALKPSETHQICFLIQRGLGALLVSGLPTSRSGSRMMPMQPFVMPLNAKRNYCAVVTAIACSMLLVLPGCVIPKLRQADPGECMPFTFIGVTTPDNSAQLPIAEFF